MTNQSWIDAAVNESAMMCSPGEEVCGFCSKPGLRVLPLRHSAFAGENAAVVNALPAVPAKAQSRTTLVQLKPAVRVMREGFLYVLLDRSGTRRWQAYHALPTGQLLPIGAGEQPAPAEEDAFSCTRSQHPELAMLVSIERPEEVADSWWLFTPTAMTRRMLDAYRQNIEDHHSHGRVQHFSPAAWAGGQRQARDTLLADEVGEMALEYRAARLVPAEAVPVMDMLRERISERVEGERLAESLEAETFPPFRSPLSGPARARLEAPVVEGGSFGRPRSTMETMFGPAKPRGLAAAAPHLRGVLELLAEEEAPALVLEDPIGVTQEANGWRNAALELARPWLQAPGVGGVNREWKFAVRKTFDTVREGYSERRVAAHLQRRMSGIEQRMHAEGVPESMMDDVLGWHEHGVRTRLEERAQRGDFQREFDRKYLSRMDEGAMDAFDEEFKLELAKVELEMERRADEVIGLLTSNALIAALHVYDRDDLRSGWHFVAQTGLCINGLGSSAKGADLIHGWWSAATFCDGNLAWRATAVNQTALMDELEQLLAQSQAASTRRSDALSATEVLGQAVPITQGLVSSFDAASAVLESMPSHNSMLAAVMAWNVSLGQAFFRSASPTALDRRVHYVLDGVLRAIVGPRAVEAIEQRMVASGRTPDRAGIQRGVESRMAHASNQSLWNRTHADIGRVRQVSALAFLEGAALFLRARELPKESREWAELAGGAVMTASAGFEILATYTETQLGRSAAGTANAREMRITLGGLRVWAAGLGSVAGGVFAVYDAIEARDAFESDEYGLTLAYFARFNSTIALIVGQSGLAIAAGQELFRRLSLTARTSFVRALSAGAAKLATALSRQALQLILARMVFMGGVAGVVVTGIIMIMSPNALQKWCDNSCFSKDGPSKPYGDSGEEVGTLLASVERVI